jgi:hypothetical protein
MSRISGPTNKYFHLPEIHKAASLRLYFLKYSIRTIAYFYLSCIFVLVFHRILDFKDGAGFLSCPLFLSIL